jgi:hypothetical protein
MSDLSDNFIYKIEDTKLIIESCPNKTIYSYLVRDLLKNPSSAGVMINEIEICEGIEVIDGAAFSHLGNIHKVTLPNSLKEIGKLAFSWCEHLENVVFPSNTSNSIEIGESAFFFCRSLKNLNIPYGVTSIGIDAFAYCHGLKNIYLPDSLVSLGRKAFIHCDNLKTVRLSANIREIKNSTFQMCENLENVTFLEGLNKIGDDAFHGCSSLKSICFPSSLIEIGKNAFFYCEGLENISFNEGLEKIGISAFSNCICLKEVILPISLKYIEEHAFMSCNLTKVYMGDRVKRIGRFAFAYCDKLEDITLSKSLVEIPYHAFYNCFNLTKLTLPDNVEMIGQEAFYGCERLRELVLSKELKRLSQSCFSGCEKLERIVIPEGVEEIEANVFHNCYNITEIHLPRTIKKFSYCSFDEDATLSYIFLNNNENIISLDSNFSGFIPNPDNLMFLYDINDDSFIFYNGGQYVEFKENTLLKNEKIRKLISENKYNSEMYIKLYCWSKKRFIPSDIVIENMPLSDIDNFFINNNGREWAKLINASVNVTLKENKVSFFKLCYVLGLFSESTSVRDRAIKFLNEKIVNKLDGYKIHAKFDGFDLTNGFNEDYAEFFIKYYNDVDFMILEDEGEVLDLMSSSYNNFSNVKKIYPNRTLHTNRDADLLLPVHVMNAVRITRYKNVDIENEKFALIVGKYGYTQEQFERLQSWHNEGKQITEMELFIQEDKDECITYKLLDKKDPLNAVLGNITNCCQVVGAGGESCVKYGMTKPNSGFLTFIYKDKIVGQAWVWYDEKSKTICLDNIEIPHRYLEKISQNKTIQKGFIDCLLRIEKSFKKAMNDKGLKVDRVTIGKGYNDLKEILDKNFLSLDYCDSLNDYGGYSDADAQYEIKKLEKHYNKK